MINRQWLTITGLALSIALIFSLNYFLDKKNTQESQQVSVTDITTKDVFQPGMLILNNNKPDSTKTISALNLSLENTVPIVGEIGPIGNKIAQEIIQKSKTNKVVYVVLNSPGGSVFDGALIVSAIQSSKVPVKTICLQLCASMAAIIHQYGTERLVVDRSILMFHDAAGGLEGYLPHMKSRIDMLTSFIKKMNADIANRSGMDLDAFEAAEHQELWLDAEDAIQRKFADRMVSVFFETSLFQSPVTQQLLAPNVDTNKQLGLGLKNVLTK